MSEKSYYEIMELSKNASDVDIKKQYKKMTMKWHPDRVQDPAKKEESNTMIKLINEAYDVLKDPQKKQTYDRYGKKGLDEQNHMPPNMEEMLRAMQQQQQQQRRHTNIPPIKLGVGITLENIYNGKTFETEIERHSLCSVCSATGFSDGSTHECSSCNGVGQVMGQQEIAPGFMQRVQRPCSKCRGSGQDSNSVPKCKTCTGSKLIKEKVKLKMDIQKGVKNGDKIQIENKGNEIPSTDRQNDGITRGPIILIIQEVEHDVFKRGVVISDHMDPSNICITIDITLAESIAGFKKTFTHLDGRKLYVWEQDIIKNDDIKLIVGEGLPVRGKDYKKGDLYVKYNVIYPDILSDENKFAIYKILTDKDYLEEEMDDDYQHSDTFKVGNHSNRAYDSDSDDDPNEQGAQMGPEGVNCAQQ
jgi:DnaJ family protein A protein 2